MGEVAQFPTTKATFPAMISLAQRIRAVIVDHGAGRIEGPLADACRPLFDRLAELQAHAAPSPEVRARWDDDLQRMRESVAAVDKACRAAAAN